MNSARIFLKKEYHILCVVLFSIVTAIVFAGLMGNNVKEVLEDYPNALGERIIEKIYDSSEMQSINYIVNGDSYTSQNNDPQLIISGVNTYISSINIVFGKPITQDIPIAVYWGIDGEGFTPDRVKTANANAGIQNIKISFGEKATDLRLDIGTTENISFTLSHVMINEGIPKTLAGRLIQCIKENMGTKVWFDRFQIVFIISVFVLLHFVVNIRNMYKKLFEKRWIVAGFLLLFLVVNKYHGDSITCFDNYVQTGEGSDYIYPVLGEERPIRSDEWLVDTPINLSTQYLENPYGKYNYLVRGTNTINSSMLTIVSVLNPVNLVSILIRFIFGYEYAYSYTWYINILLSFLFQLELFLIMSSHKKLLSTCGACMVVLSSHYLWWGFSTLILYSSVALVCSYYFFKSDSRKKRLLYAYGTALGTALFALVLYPAWEVPMAFYSLVVFVWIVHDCWDNIKKMSREDWTILVSALLLCIIMILQSIVLQMEYVEAISKTVYPGKRIDNGGFAIGKLFNYISAISFAYKDCGNPSERGMYITLFPFPLIMALYTWIKGNRRNWLLNGLMIISVFLGVYTTVGLPSVLAKITLMTSTVASRCVDILGYTQVALFVVTLSAIDYEKKLEKKYAFVLAIVMSGIAMMMANHEMPEYMSGEYRIIFFEIFALIFFCFIAKVDKKIYNWGLIAVIMISIVTAIYVRPIVKGTDAIYSKPVANEIQRIASKDSEAKWIAYDSGVTAQFILACGAPAINSVNKYPNMELWNKLDPTGNNEYIYNRYAHFAISFTDGETNMELIQDDVIRLNLGFKDLKKTEAKYIFSTQPLNVDNQYAVFNEVYYDYGAYIYEVYYH